MIMGSVSFKCPYNTDSTLTVVLPLCQTNKSVRISKFFKTSTLLRRSLSDCSWKDGWPVLVLSTSFVALFVHTVPGYQEVLNYPLTTSFNVDQHFLSLFTLYLTCHNRACHFQVFDDDVMSYYQSSVSVSGGEQGPGPKRLVSISKAQYDE